ncbi:FixH family protein [Thalassolituus marinus]|uniref:FixH family protein n=1 Tax=Thalassolituus marinus TaxID=671053 RepID=A0ABS7ZMB2_9GAMM|nr:FixH family protein [Thalassolituus marinus]MCA6062854.1 FixH family protein [Thalassolituus marinus]
MKSVEKSTPWYKEPMILLVAGIPLLAVIWGMVMLKLALASQDSLVSDSYYKDGVSYTENVETDNKAKRLQLNADLTITHDEVELTLKGYLDEMPATLQLMLIHPTLDTQDATVLLQRMDDGIYRGVNEIYLPGRRHIWLQSPEQGWRIRLTELLESGKTVHMSAK